MSRFLVVLSAALCWGCFVLDELEEGQRVMEQLGPGKNAQTSQEAAPRESGPEEPGVLERVQAWWAEVRRPDPVGPDPNNRIVRCTLGGSAQFMRESDCELRSGRAHASGG